MESIQAFTFAGIRTLLGAFVLVPVVLIKNRGFRLDSSTRKTLQKIIPLGVVFCIAGNFQQFAFYYSTSGKIAFITALYMFFVPLFGLFFKKKVSLPTWIAVFMGFIGLFLLCMNPDEITAINRGDILALFCAVFYAIHIMLIDHVCENPEIDGVMLSCGQFFVSGILSIILMFVFEQPQLDLIIKAAPALAYSGIMSCGVAYTFQILGQKHCEPVVASLLMCLESVFAVIAGALFLHEMLSVRELIGCIIMFAAIIISQLVQISPKKNNPGSEA